MMSIMLFHSRAQRLPSPFLRCVDSSFNGITSSGGGFGGGRDITRAGSGGSGGGGGITGVAGNGLPGYGFTTFGELLHTITPYGNTTVNTTTKKFDGGSIYFDGGNDALILGSSSDFAYGTDDFTIECWVKFNNLTEGYIYDGRASNLAASRILFGIGGGSLSYSVGGTSRISVTASSFLGTTLFHHIAISRNGTSTRMFVDGNQVGSTWTTDTTSYLTTTAGPYMGALFNPAYGELSGYIDEIRISNTARYTSAFDVATSAFEGDANTLLLIHGDATIQDDRERQGYDGGTSFLSTSYGSGGGGGASEVGSNGSSSAGGQGGDGKVNTISGSTHGESSGGSYYLGGGGSGSLYSSSTTFPGPLGGGGNGGGTPTAGDTNKGAGGGAGWSNNTAGYDGAAGGSGVVIIRYKFKHTA